MQAGRSAAEARGQRRGGRLHLRALLVGASQKCPARPATSDEVRRIYRLPPLPRTSLESQQSTSVSWLDELMTSMVRWLHDSMRSEVGHLVAACGGICTESGPY